MTNFNKSLKTLNIFILLSFVYFTLVQYTYIMFMLCSVLIMICILIFNNYQNINRLEKSQFPIPFYVIILILYKQKVVKTLQQFCYNQIQYIKLIYFITKK